MSSSVNALRCNATSDARLPVCACPVVIEMSQNCRSSVTRVCYGVRRHSTSAAYELHVEIDRDTERYWTCLVSSRRRPRISTCEGCLTAATKSTNTQFHGPADLARLWTQYVNQYTESGALSAEADNAAKLDDLAFGNGLERMAALHAADPQGFQRMRGELEDAARALSAISRTSGAMRTLQHAVVQSLIGQWLELRSAQGVGEHVNTAPIARTKKINRLAMYEQREALLKTPAGALLAGALKMAEDQPIRSQIAGAMRRSRSGLSFSEALTLAYDQFDNALFKYRADAGCTFSTYVMGAMKRWLPVVMSRAAAAQDSVPHNVRRTAVFKQLHAADDQRRRLDHNPAAAAEAVERDESIAWALERLKPTERRVLRLRYGLEDGTQYTYDQIGDMLGVTKQRAEQINKAGVTHCRRLFEAREEPDDQKPSRFK